MCIISTPSQKLVYSDPYVPCYYAEQKDTVNCKYCQVAPLCKKYGEVS